MIINLANLRHVDTIINQGTVSIKGFSFPLRIVRVRQIEIQNPFELVITCAPLTEYEGLDTTYPYLAARELPERRTTNCRRPTFPCQ